MIRLLNAHLLGRFAQSLITIFALITVVFFIFRLLPGDPFSVYLDASLPRTSIDAVRRDFGLDRPLIVQYALYLKNTARGEFGYSFYYRRPVMDVIGGALWPTIVLMGTSMILAFLLGTLLGAALAWWRNSRWEWAGLSAALVLRSIPEFWVGLIALVLFSYKLGWLPAGGMTTIGGAVDGAWRHYLSLDLLRHLVLPVLVSALTYIAIPMLVMRNAMLETLREDYLELARAKGLPETAILFRHAMRNALLPTITVFALMAAFAVGGQVVIETIFRWPGMGRELVLAIQRRDYPVLQTALSLMGVLVVVVNFLTDVAYGLLDPRVSAH